MGGLLRDPPSQGEESLLQPFSPWREHACYMLPREMVRGSCIFHLYTPKTLVPRTQPLARFSTDLQGAYSY